MHFRQIERQARRMVEMIERLGVDTLKLSSLDQGAGYVRARIACFDCSNAAQCLYWLDASSADAAPPIFCPNYATFVACKRDA